MTSPNGSSGMGLQGMWLEEMRTNVSGWGVLELWAGGLGRRKADTERVRVWDGYRGSSWAVRCEKRTDMSASSGDIVCAGYHRNHDFFGPPHDLSELAHVRIAGWDL